MVIEQLTQAFVLHSRSYRETSLLVELFTKSHGRISVIARGVKRNKKTGLLQQFVPLFVAWRGRSTLPTLSVYEAASQNLQLKSSVLIAGMYLNELLMLTLPRFDAHEVLFDWYEQSLFSLMQDDESNKAVVLRRFEKVLLKELGYEIQFEQYILPFRYYRFVPDTGFVALSSDYVAFKEYQNIFLGKQLLQIAANNYEDNETILAAKHLFQLALAPVLSGKKIKSLVLLVQ